MGLDYGQKRIGIAVSDPLNSSAYALPFIENSSTVIDALKTLITTYDVDHIVMGWPLNLRGEESAACKHVLAFTDMIKGQLSLPIDFWDERLSTVSAEKHLLSLDVSRKKRKSTIDSQAAVFILQGYLDRLHHQKKAAE